MNFDFHCKNVDFLGTRMTRMTRIFIIAFGNIAEKRWSISKILKKAAEGSVKNPRHPRHPRSPNPRSPRSQKKLGANLAAAPNIKLPF
ncbi:MAG: hypothetical protein J0M29_12225 [Chitinophagales bacterium]|nr:hypothetical protein [Chitinophagales bacterium]